MLDISRIFQWKNRTGTGSPVPIVLLELEYATGQFVRFARYNRVVTFDGHDWLPFPIAPVEVSESSQGETPAHDIAFSNVGREFQSILEFYDIEGTLGRLLWVHPDDLDDPTAAVVENFTVLSAHVDRRNAAITVTPINFDPLDVELPRATVTQEEFPAILGIRVAHL
jgi:hypothetical protein